MSQITDHLEEQIAKISAAPSLDSWSSLVEEVQCPPEVFAAIMTGRPEVLRAAPATSLEPAQVRELYKVLAVLIETNAALQKHAHGLSDLTREWSRTFKGLIRLARATEDYAAFRVPSKDGDDHD